MRRVARVSLAVVCCSSIFAGACSDSTSPKPSLDPAALAAHFDSLYVAALASGTESGGARASDLAFLEIAPAMGAKPVDVTVTTDRATEFWRGFMVEVIYMNAGAPFDSTYLLMAYRDADAHTMLFADYSGDGSFADGGVFTDTTLDIAARLGTGSTTRTPLGSACATPSSSLSNPVVAHYASLPCNRSTYLASVTMEMPNAPVLDLPFQSLSVSATAFNGARFLNMEVVPGIVGRIPALLHASRSRSKL